jgi:type II secretory pathway pseudopilin PulG
MNRRGTTLVELLIVIPLVAILFSMVWSFLIPGLRAWTRSDTRSQAQQSALVVSARLVKEVQYSMPESVSIFPASGPAPDGTTVAQDAVSFVSDLGEDGRVQLDPSGSPLWQTRLVFYYDALQQGVRLQQQVLDPSTDPQPLKATSFIPNPQDRVLARNVRSLSIQASSGALPLSIVVEARMNSYSSRLETVADSLLNTLEPPSSASPGP